MSIDIEQLLLQGHTYDTIISRIEQAGIEDPHRYLSAELLKVPRQSRKSMLLTNLFTVQRIMRNQYMRALRGEQGAEQSVLRLQRSLRQLDAEIDAFEQQGFAAMSEQEVAEHFRSLVEYEPEPLPKTAKAAIGLWRKLEGTLEECDLEQVAKAWLDRSKWVTLNRVIEGWLDE